MQIVGQKWFEYMDLIAILKDKIEGLEEGEYKPGLRAALLHIETAIRHLYRGQKENDDTAFTDVIYRTNQAFEGSIKEAYRVLAGKDPSKKTSYEIENYLERENIFRSRVLQLFTNYRTDWRNPSTHDYKLDFDNSEAFLAIVSVTAFACVLLDEIYEKLSFLKAKEETLPKTEEIRRKISLSEHDLTQNVVRAVQEFMLTHQPFSLNRRDSEIQIIGALHGFLSTTLPDVKVLTEAPLDPKRPFRVDLLVKDENDSVLIEVKRRFYRKNFENAKAQVEHYMLLGNIKNGILLFIIDDTKELIIEQHYIKSINGNLVVMMPKNDAQHLYGLRLSRDNSIP
jgi:hypothetical protein